MASENDAQELYDLILKTITKHFPDLKFGDRTDFVMEMYQVFHQWATGTSDENNGATKSVVMMDVDING